MRLRTLLTSLLLTLLASVASAQAVAFPTQHIGFDEAQPVAVAQAATYNVYVDAQASAVATGLLCTASAGASVCRVDIPALTVGLHTVRLAQVIAGQESAQSDPLTFQLVVLAAPTNLRIVIALTDLGFQRA